MNFRRSIWISALCLAVAVFIASPVSRAQQLLISESEKIDFAQGLRQQGQYELAVAQFEEFIQQFPQSALQPDAYLGAAECRFFLKEYDKAVDLLQKYLSQFPSNKDLGIAKVRLGQALYVQGKLDDALKQFNDVTPDGLTGQFKQTLFFFKGQILATQNNPTEAVTNLQMAAENPESTAYTAQSYFKWGTLIAEKDPNAALEKYAKALAVADNSELKASIMVKQGEANYLLKQYDQAEAVFKSVVDSYPGLPVITDAIANWYTTLIQLKKYDVLTGHFNQQLQGAVDKPEYFQIYLAVAKALSASGNVDGAAAVLDKVLAIAGLSDENKQKVTLQKTRMYMDSGKFNEALAFMDTQPVSDPVIKSQMMLLKAKALLSIKEYDKSWAVYEEVSKDFSGMPAYAEALCGMAYVRYAQGQFDPSAGLFMDCSVKTQDDNLKADALYNAFISYRKSGNEDKALEIAEQYTKITPAAKNQAEVVLALSGMYSKRQMYDKANEILAPFLNDPDETRRRNAVFQSAYNLQLSGKTEEALKSYETFMSDGKNDRLTYLAYKNSCMIYLQNKDEEKAADLMAKAIAGFEDNDFPLKTYYWLVEHWQAKSDAAKMLEVLTAAQKHHTEDPEAIGIKFYSGQAYRMQDNCKAALENYDAVIKSEEKFGYRGRSRLGKGVCLTGIGDYEGAAKELEQAVVDSPDDAFVAMRARFALANNATYLKQYDMAVKLYLVVDVLYNDPEYAPKALMRAGTLLEENLNNKKEAVNAYKKIVDMYPNSPEAAQAQDKLTKLK